MIKLRKHIARILVLVLIAGLFTSLFSEKEAKADSNDRRWNYIHLAQGKNTVNDFDQLSDEEAQVLALYLTNYLRPRETRILQGSNDKESDYYKACKDALLTIGINEYIVDKYIDYITKVNVSSIKELAIPEDRLLYMYEVRESGGVSFYDFSLTYGAEEEGWRLSEDNISSVYVSNGGESNDDNTSRFTREQFLAAYKEAFGECNGHAGYYPVTYSTLQYLIHFPSAMKSVGYFINDSEFVPLNMNSIDFKRALATTNVNTDYFGKYVFYSTTNGDLMTITEGDDNEDDAFRTSLNIKDLYTFCSYTQRLCIDWVGTVSVLCSGDGELVPILPGGANTIVYQTTPANLVNTLDSYADFIDYFQAILKESGNLAVIDALDNPGWCFDASFYGDDYEAMEIAEQKFRALVYSFKINHKIGFNAGEYDYWLGSRFESAFNGGKDPFEIGYEDTEGDMRYSAFVGSTVIAVKPTKKVAYDAFHPYTTWNSDDNFSENKANIVVKQKVGSVEKLCYDDNSSGADIGGANIYPILTLVLKYHNDSALNTNHIITWDGDEAYLIATANAGASGDDYQDKFSSWTSSFVFDYGDGGNKRIGNDTIRTDMTFHISKYKKSTYNSSNNVPVIYADNYASITDDSTLSTVFKYVSDFDNLKALQSDTGEGVDAIKQAAFKTGINRQCAQSLFFTYAFLFWNSKFWDKQNNTWTTEPDILKDYWIDFTIYPTPDEHFSINFQQLQEDMAGDSNEMQAQTQSWIYYLLNPSSGFSYIKTWVKNKVTAVMLGWHEDMVGGTSSNSSTGMTAFLGFSGYVTTPSINDLEWMTNIVNMYDSIIVYILILLVLVILCYVITSQISLGRGILGFICFAVMAFLPPVMIDSVVNISNDISMEIYTKKFDYWAICQMEQYLGQLAKIEESDPNSQEYVLSVIEANRLKDENTSAAANFTGVRLKWMAPKKANGGAVVTELLKKSSYAGFSDTVVGRLMTASYAQNAAAETYVPDALYLYRDQLDLYRVSSVAYNLYSTYNYKGMLTDDAAKPTGYNSTAPGTNTNVRIHTSLRCVNMFDKYNDYYGRYNLYKQEPSIWGFYDINADVAMTKAAVNVEKRPSNIDENDFNTAYSLSSIVRMADDTCQLYTSEFSPRWAKKMGFIYGSNPTKKKGYLSNSTLALSYLLRFNHVETITRNEYYKLKKFIESSSSGTPIVINTQTVCGDYVMRINGVDEVIDSSDDSMFDPYLLNAREALFGLPPAMFKYTVQHIQGRKDINFCVEDDASTNRNGANVSHQVDNVDEEADFLSAYYYGLYSESPYYYFNWNIRDQLIESTRISPEDAEGLDDDGESTSENTAVTGYNYNPDNLLAKTDALKSLWLYADQSYFYNYKADSTSGYGELRDFMNLRNLFYYVIPQMRWGVELNRLWDKTYGCTYDMTTSSVKLDADGTIRVDNVIICDERGHFDKNYIDRIFGDNSPYTKQQQYQIWHDLNVIQLYYAYCPWLDAMLDCDYAKSETIPLLEGEYVVSDPLNPYTYCEFDSYGRLIDGRPMVFSRAEMAYYGLEEGDLTTVEKKCIKLQDAVYEKTLELMNYYTFSDEVLIQAYSMIQLFEFNNIFSQESLVKEDYIMYPQGYELKAFSYDAYLRMILAGSTGVDIMSEAGESGNTSIYERIAEKTSIFFGIILIINDIVAVYVVPLLKVFFIVAIFFISLLMILGAAVKVEMNILTVAVRSLLQPLGLFLVINIGFAFIVSLFLGGGAQGVVKTSTVISLGDPTMALIAMLIINIVVLILYFKLCKKCKADLAKYAKEVLSSVGSTVAEVGGSAAKALAAGAAFAGMKSALGRAGRTKDSKDKKSSGGDSSIDSNPEKRGESNVTPKVGGAKTGEVTGLSQEGKNKSSTKENPYDKAIKDSKAKGKSETDTAKTSKTESTTTKTKKESTSSSGSDGKSDKSGASTSQKASKHKGKKNYIKKHKNDANNVEGENKTGSKKKKGKGNGSGQNGKANKVKGRKGSKSNKSYQAKTNAGKKAKEQITNGQNKSGKKAGKKRKSVKLAAKKRNNQAKAQVRSNNTSGGSTAKPVDRSKAHPHKSRNKTGRNKSGSKNNPSAKHITYKDGETPSFAPSGSKVMKKGLVTKKGAKIVKARKSNSSASTNTQATPTKKKSVKRALLKGAGKTLKFTAKAGLKATKFTADMAYGTAVAGIAEVANLAQAGAKAMKNGSQTVVNNVTNVVNDATNGAVGGTSNNK